jgi:[ribosomal protein S18]-alanine N-acetyltransferase
MGYLVRPMQMEDIPQVSEIDREAFPTQWPPPPFKKDLNNRLMRCLVALEETNATYQWSKMDEHKAEENLGVISKLMRLLNRGRSSNHETVIKPNQNIVGYAAMWFIVDEAHLTSIAVRQTHRRQGIGDLLLISIIDLATQLNARLVTLEVRVSNLAAQRLYERYGFTRVGERRGYYSDDGEDAIIMSTEKITSAPYQARLQKSKKEYIQNGKKGNLAL